MRTLLGILGVVVALFSALFVVGAIFNLLSPDPAGGLGGQIFALIFFLVPGLLGAYLAWQNLRPRPTRPRLTERDREQLVLDLADAQGGRVTVAQVAARCDLGIDEAKAVLDRMAVHGVADLQVTDEGGLVYVFRGLGLGEQQGEAGKL